MPLPEHLHRFWASLDAFVADVAPTAWGAVVTSRRFPDVWDANYARLDVAIAVTASQIETDLLPALRAAGAGVEHVVTFHHEEHGDLLAELSSRGHRISWDLVMAVEGTPPPGDGIVVEQLAPGDELWGAAAGSMRDVFAIEPAAAVDQLLELERELLAPAGKRWFGVRDGTGRPVSLGTLFVLDGTGYVDNVATVPDARRRGYASAVVTRIVEEASRSGATHLILLTDPEAPAVVRMYERLGFRGIGRLASTKGLMPDA